MNIAAAERYLQTFPGDSRKLAEVYDDDDVLRSALAQLFPDFEYPDFSYLTIAEIRRRYERRRTASAT